MIDNLLIASLCFVWGATWVAIKIGLSQSPPFYGASFRFALALVILGVVAAVRRKPWPKDKAVWAWIVASGVLMYFGSYAVVYYVEQYIDAALCAILFAAMPFFVAIGAHFHLEGERLSTVKIVGLVVGFGGIVAVFGGGVSAPSTGAWWAPGLMLMSPFCSAVASIMVKKHLTREDPVTVNLLQMAIGVLVLFPVAMATERFGDFHWTARAIGAVLFLGTIGSAFAFVTLYHLLRTKAATHLSLIAFVTPVVAAILGWLILDEKLTWMTAAGALLVLAGIWIVNVWAERRSARAAA